MRLSIFDLSGRPYYQANIWVYMSSGDPLAIEFFSTKREAVAFIKRFKMRYKGGERLDCYVNKFDCDDYWEATWNYNKEEI